MDKYSALSKGIHQFNLKQFDQAKFILLPILKSMSDEVIQKELEILIRDGNIEYAKFILSLLQTSSLLAPITDMIDGILHYEIGRPHEAILSLRKSLKQVELANCYFYLGKAYLELGYSNTSNIAFNHYLLEVPSAVQTNFYIGVNHAFLGNLEESLHHFNNVLDSVEDSSIFQLARIHKTVVLRKLHQYALAEKELEQIVLDNRELEAFYNLEKARIRFQQSDFHATLMHITEAEALMPDDHDILNLKANALIELGEFEPALILLDQILKDKQIGYLYYRKGMLLNRLQEYDQAIFSLNTAIQIDPLQILPKFEKAKSLFHLNESYAGIELCLEILNQESDQPTLELLYQIYIDLKDFKNALLIVNQMEELEGENYYTVISRIVTRYLMGERDLEQIESALKNYPEDPFLWELKGTIHFELENFDKASQALRTAVGYGSQEGKVFVYLGVSLLELHDFDEGLSYFDQALLLEPDDRDVYQFYQRAVTYANLIEQLR
ncbi:MAG: hypothetical protein ACW98K_08055 [Candidatus Kariarchaeaceae archaeon]|jgi:tetratricopeptide (TPR) repeat protein